jgi:3-dehydroquinate synthase
MGKLPEHIRISLHPGEDLNNYLRQRGYSNVFLLADTHTQKHCLPRINPLPEYAQRLVIPPGEEHKSLETCVKVWDFLTHHRADRHAVLVLVGGGVLCDLGGFCASTYKRGIDFISLPTTLLAQADASIGGKVGIDFDHYKNQLGTFQEPALTLLWDGFLTTLPANELKSGFAEVIKHVLISDAALWDIVRHRSLAQQDWPALLQHSAEFKWSIVQQDPREQGLRKILNAGHTVGHALETYLLANGSTVSHGEAVAAGLLCESYLACQRNLLSQTELRQIEKFILSVYGKLTVPKDLQNIAGLCLQDKKNKGNKILASLPDGIGRARWDCEVSLSEIVDALAYYSAL